MARRSGRRVRAFAKINRSLHVLGRRPDGYHELRTVFQSIALHDTLIVGRCRGPFRFTCSDPALPVDRSNLIVRAADAVWAAAGRHGQPEGAFVHLVKRIPVGSGLGGGSSDGAAALLAMGRLWRVDEPRVRTLAPAIGADVPFFFEGGTVLGLERGDLLFPLLDLPRAWVVLAVPPFAVSTKDAYRWWDLDAEAADRAGKAGKAGNAGRVDNAVQPRGVHNDLQHVVATRHPEIARLAATLTRCGASEAAMTGSGSAVFGLFESRSAAARAARAVGPTVRTIVTRTLTRVECRRQGLAAARPGLARN